MARLLIPLLCFVASIARADGVGACKGIPLPQCEALVEGTLERTPASDEADLIYHAACRSGVAAGCLLYGRSPGAELAEIDVEVAKHTEIAKAECTQGRKLSCAALERATRNVAGESKAQ